MKKVKWKNLIRDEDYSNQNKLARLDQKEKPQGHDLLTLLLGCLDTHFYKSAYMYILCSLLVACLLLVLLTWQTNLTCTLSQTKTFGHPFITPIWFPQTVGTTLKAYNSVSYFSFLELRRLAQTCSIMTMPFCLTSLHKVTNALVASASPTLKSGGC